MSLFDDEDDGRRHGSSDPPATAAGTPLAERMRPRTLDEIVGQEDILGSGKPLREAIERDLLQSIIFWGPPGTGKTHPALAPFRVLASLAGSRSASVRTGSRGYLRSHESSPASGVRARRHAVSYEGCAVAEVQRPSRVQCLQSVLEPAPGAVLESTGGFGGRDEGRFGQLVVSWP